MRLYLIIIFIFFSFFSIAQTYTLSGYVTDSETSEPINAAVIFDKFSNIGVYANEQGYYSLTVNNNETEIVVSYPGYSSSVEKITLTKDEQKDFKLILNTIEEVEITASGNMVLQNKTGSIELSIKEIKAMPLAGFQSDIIKSVQVLPGVNSGTEGMSALIVRGGNSDQNLVTIDGIPLYHYNHLDGLVSSISTEAVSNLKLIKSGFPAKYGNRLSSVMDIRLKNGDMNHYHSNLSVGLLTSGLSVNGPIEKNTSSFIASIRGFTLQPFIALFPYAANDKFFDGYGFGDLFIKLNRKLKNDSRVYASFYFGKDKRKSNNFDNSEKKIYKWGNILGSLYWTKQLNPHLFSKMSLYVSDYKNSLKTSYFDIGNPNEIKAWAKDKSSITETAYKWDLEYSISSKLKSNFGLYLGRQYFSPNAFNSESIKEQPNYKAPVFNSNMAALYLNTDFNFFNFLGLSTGIRLNTLLSKNKLFVQPEPRLVVSINLNNYNSFKASYSLMHQNFHSLSVSSLGIKSNYFIPASKILRPQSSEQYSVGYYTAKSKKYNFSVEAFYKNFSNLVELKEFVALTDKTQSWEEKSESNGIGEAKGIEVFFGTQIKNINIGVSYTLSKSTRQFKNINNGFEYLYDFDQTHDFSIFFTGKINKKWSYNISWYYMTGRPISLATEYAPITFPWSHFHPNSIADYAVTYGKNNIRLEDYHRLDISFERTVIKTKKRTSERKLKLGVYNIYNRENPYFYQWDKPSVNYSPPLVILTKKVYFPIIPFLSYSITY